MEACTIETTGTNKNAVELAEKQYTAKTAGAGSTTALAKIVGETGLEAIFPLNSYIKNATDGTWHRITAAADNAADFDVTVSPASSTVFDAAGGAVQAHEAPRIIGCTLVATGSGKSINTDAETPVIISHNSFNLAIDGNVKDVIAQDSGVQTNVTSQHVAVIPD